MRAIEMRHSGSAYTFAMRLRASRQRAGMTPEAVAAAVHVTVKRITTLEAGGSAPPTAQQVAALARALNVPALWLLAGDLAGAQFRPAWYAPGGAA